MANIDCVIQDSFHITQIRAFFTRVCRHEFPGDSHSFWESMYVLDGSLCVTANDRIYDLSAGQCIFHQPQELHKFRITSPDGAKILVFSFSAEGKLCDFFREKVFTLNENQKQILNMIVTLAESHADDSAISYRRYHAAIKTVPFFPQRISSFFEIMMLSLAENNIPAPLIPDDDSNNYITAVHYLSERVAENLTIEEIANELHMSSSTLKRTFQKYAGMGVHKYFLKLKIKKAIELLESGDSVTLIARKLNFSSQANFTNAFKRETGNTPSSYRNKNFK